MRDTRNLAAEESVADYLDVPRATLKQWRYLRTGPPWIYVGRHVRYRWTAVETWLEQQTMPPTHAH